MSDTRVRGSSDLEAAVSELSDEQAIAIMEGRAPARDTLETDAAVRDLAERLLSEPSDAPAARRSGVIPLVTQQPWMRMAAAMLLGVAVTTLVTTGARQSGQATSLASSDVVYLEVYRGAAQDLPSVALPEADAWISLVAYPDFTDADSMQVHVERRVGDETPDGSWRSVFEDTIGVGSRDSVVVNLRSGLFQPGEYRLRIEARRDDRTTSSTTTGFLITASST